MDTYKGGGCGGLYNLQGPRTCSTVLACVAAARRVWQTYDMEYGSRRKDGRSSGRPKLTVYHNGIRSTTMPS
jgi:hypothetical protein